MSQNSAFIERVEQAVAGFKVWSEANGSNDFDAFLAFNNLTESVAEEARQRIEQRMLDGTITSDRGVEAPFPETATADLPLHSDRDSPYIIGRYHVAKVLGKGGFGIVYLAYDSQLQRSVAIKVPHAHLVSRSDDAQAYLTEARTVANLDHPHIVPVYDVGQSDDFPCFVVSKYIEGFDLRAKLKQQRFGFHEVAQLVATIADALHYAHKQGLVHRDVKPGNILLGNDGRAYVVDFGLALKEQDRGTGPGFTGTPVYMSPEQARGEGHRVDGRSDIYSLGTMFYELLVGFRPFNSGSLEELIILITEQEVKPPRQIDDAIPRELERICLKCLAKRANDRYTTALDMAEDLRHYLLHHPSTTTSTFAVIPPIAPAISDSTKADMGQDTLKFDSAGQAIRIVPKGLRSFDAHDADFFLELLPGPRDRDGLPEIIRFWKSRIEELDADKTHSVGLIYGPSGCGKSSLVKAGLIPRLSPDVITVYLEATPDDTDVRLLNAIGKRCQGLGEKISLSEMIAAIRRGDGVPSGKKIVIVLDQIEQWLHTHREVENTELVRALRQCDGGRVQCILLVRDDFWMAATRFMQALEVPQIEGENSAAVNLFSVQHARKVLAAIGHAYGALPERTANMTPDQEKFLDLAVEGLAEEGQVICVRLALFAEMMKSRSWNPATLKQVGGTTGLGVTFLEETFSAKTAAPHHRFHQVAARAVLKALMPDSGADIKGQLISYDRLLEESGYANRPQDFKHLINLLDRELHLITPTDSIGLLDSDDIKSDETARKHYQLAHDFLVPPLREWLVEKQKETVRGRAELRLKDRSDQWNRFGEKRFLPSPFEFLSIAAFTRSERWTTGQRVMLKQAFWTHARRMVSGLMLIAIAAVLLVFMLRSTPLEILGNQYRDVKDRIAAFETLDLDDQEVQTVIEKVFDNDIEHLLIREMLSSLDRTAPHTGWKEESRESAQLRTFLTKEIENLFLNKYDSNLDDEAITIVDEIGAKAFKIYGSLRAPSGVIELINKVEFNNNMESSNKEMRLYVGNLGYDSNSPDGVPVPELMDIVAGSQDDDLIKASLDALNKLNDDDLESSLKELPKETRAKAFNRFMEILSDDRTPELIDPTVSFLNQITAKSLLAFFVDAAPNKSLLPYANRISLKRIDEMAEEIECQLSSKGFVKEASWIPDEDAFLFRGIGEFGSLGSKDWNRSFKIIDSIIKNHVNLPITVIESFVMLYPKQKEMVKDAAAITEIKLILRDPHTLSSVRIAAAQALADLKNQDSLQLFLELARNEENREVRRVVVRNLDPFMDGEGRQKIEIKKLLLELLVPDRQTPDDLKKEVMVLFRQIALPSEINVLTPMLADKRIGEDALFAIHWIMALNGESAGEAVDQLLPALVSLENGDLLPRQAMNFVFFPNSLDDKKQYIGAAKSVIFRLAHAASKDLNEDCRDLAFANLTSIAKEVAPEIPVEIDPYGDKSVRDKQFDVWKQWWDENQNKLSIKSDAN